MIFRFGLTEFTNNTVGCTADIRWISLRQSMNSKEQLHEWIDGLACAASVSQKVRRSPVAEKSVLDDSRGRVLAADSVYLTAINRASV